MKMFKKNKFVFFIWKKELELEIIDRVDNNKNLLKTELNNYINNSVFNKRKIKYAENYYKNDPVNNFSFLTTFELKEVKENKLFIALLYDMYAFTSKMDDKIFDFYNYEVKELKNESQIIRIYKFKIK